MRHHATPLLVAALLLPGLALAAQSTPNVAAGRTAEPLPAPTPVPPAAAPPVASPAPASAEVFGPWRLACANDPMTDKAACRLIHSRWVEAPSTGQAGLVLEILHRDGQFVPAVTARDLTLEGAARGLLALSGKAQIRFSPNPLAEMPCGLEGRSLVCAPASADAARLAGELRTSPAVLLRLQSLTGDNTEAPASLPLAETEAALAKFRAGAPAIESPPPGPLGGFDLSSILQRLRDMFFQPAPPATPTP